MIKRFRNTPLVGVFILSLTLVLLLTACGAKEASRTPSERSGTDGSDPPYQSGISRETPDSFGDLSPLTGLASNQSAYERPVMVMVENSPKARPQSGLVKADLVYEVLAEGDVTRFVSVFHSDPSAQMIGPVRSIRPYFVEIGAGLDALIVHAGWSPDAKVMLETRDLDHFDDVYGDGKYYWRDKSRKMPHNLYTTVANIRRGATDKKMRSTWMNPELKIAEAAGASANAGTTFQSVKINYLNRYYVTYETMAGDRSFARGMVGKPHLDRETNEQIKTQNVLICFATHQTVDDKGRREVDVKGPDKGYLLQNGTYRPITWEHKNGAIRAFENGTEVALLPGKTWVQVVPQNTRIEWK